MYELPPTRKSREFELRALALRDFAGLRNADQRLDPFLLARYAKLQVATFEQLASALSEETVSHLLGAGKDEWSGGACSLKLPDGSRLIVLNPTHGKNRQHATLMEEVSHVFLGHKPSRLAIKNEGENGKTKARDYDAEIEEQAYCVGAAALVPYSGLRKKTAEAKSSREIAKHYGVSRALIEFRLKTTHLWKSYLKEQEARRY